MTKKSKKPTQHPVPTQPAEPRPEGRPSLYKPEYCAMLIEHCRQGGSFESFGAKVKVSKQTLYNWLEAHEAFLDARKDGEVFLHQFYEELGKMIASGQVRRLKSEKLARDKDGNPMPDGKGGWVMEREWEAATPGQSVFIFLTKNLLGWRDKRDINVAGQPDNPTPVPIEGRFSHLTKAEVEAQYRDLLKKALEDQ